MAVRVRRSGRMFCAALSKEMEGDTYIDDGVHYELSVINKVLVTTENEYHVKNGGEWWWSNRVPNGIQIEDFYLKRDVA